MRIDWVNPPLVSEAREIQERATTDLIGVVRGSDDGYRSRVQRRRQELRSFHTRPIDRPTVKARMLQVELFTHVLPANARLQSGIFTVVSHAFLRLAPTAPTAVRPVSASMPRDRACLRRR